MTTGFEQFVGARVVFGSRHGRIVKAQPAFLYIPATFLVRFDDEGPEDSCFGTIFAILPETFCDSDVAPPDPEAQRRLNKSFVSGGAL